MPNERKTKDVFENAIWLLLSNRIILRSSDQEQKELTGITRENFKAIKHVYVSNVAYDYIHLLRTNSVIFEMLLDDIYLNKNEIPYPIDYKSNFKTFNKGAFLMCLKYLNKMIEAEMKLREIIYDRNKENDFFCAFSQDFVSQILLDGLNESFNLYFRDKKIDDLDYIAQCTGLKDSIHSKINNAYNGNN